MAESNDLPQRRNFTGLYYSAILEPVFIDETGVYPADFAPAFVTVKLVYR
jgi:hypothetical protein